MAGRTTAPAAAPSCGTILTAAFGTNLRDERYLPFEGAGAISTWQLELPAAVRQFDYSTISDVVLHVRYTAREGGAALKSAAELGIADALNDTIRRAGETGMYAAFDLRQEFGKKWQALKRDKSAILNIEKSRLPHFVQSKNPNVVEVRWFARLNTSPPAYTMNLGADFELMPSAVVGQAYEGKSNPITFGADFTISAASTEELDGLVALVKYTLE